jgi:hypothetical protein
MKCSIQSYQYSSTIACCFWPLKYCYRRILHCILQLNWPSHSHIPTSYHIQPLPTKQNLNLVRWWSRPWKWLREVRLKRTSTWQCSCSSQCSRACQRLRETADRGHERVQNQKCQRAPIWPCSASQTRFPFEPPIVNSMTKVYLQGEPGLRPTGRGSTFQSQSGRFKNLLRNHSILIGWPQTRGVSNSTKRDLFNDTDRSTIGRRSRESESLEVERFIFIFQFLLVLHPIAVILQVISLNMLDT